MTSEHETSQPHPVFRRMARQPQSLQSAKSNVPYPNKYSNVTLYYTIEDINITIWCAIMNILNLQMEKKHGVKLFKYLKILSPMKMPEVIFILSLHYFLFTLPCVLLLCLSTLKMEGMVCFNFCTLRQLTAGWSSCHVVLPA